MALCAGYIITSSASMPNSISSFFFFTFFCSSYWCLGVVFECHCYFSLSCVTIYFSNQFRCRRLDTNNSESNIVIALWISYFLVFSKDIFWFNFFAIPFFFFDILVSLFGCSSVTSLLCNTKDLYKRVLLLHFRISLFLFFFWLIDEKEPKRQLLSIRTIESKKRMEYGVPV